MDELTRRQWLTAAAASTLLSACAVPAPATTEAKDDGFPVTVDHGFGATIVPTRPQRMVTVGLTEHDPVLALGVQPVGVTMWFGDQPAATWPWAQSAWGEARPRVLSATLDYEAIAALEPDLIIGINSGTDDEEYRLLSRIAPTIAQSGGASNFAMPWRAQTRAIARALGRGARGAELIAGVEARIADAARQLSGYAGRQAIMVNGGWT